MRNKTANLEDEYVTFVAQASQEKTKDRLEANGLILKQQQLRAFYSTG